VRLSDVSIDELFGALRGIVGRLPRSPEVAIAFEELPDVPVMRTDRFKLGQILRNFMVNALKFTARGEVRASAALVSGGDAVRFAVSDTGPGVAPEDQARVFEEFVQLGGDRGPLRGAGLGLALSRHLATLLGGEVGVISERGRGSTFTATIPVRFRGGPEGVEVVEAEAE
jgi:signal transduction histidine kinase